VHSAGSGVAALTGRPADFDRLARIYRALEVLAFGHDLERARFSFLDRLHDCRDILLLGEGDGRCLARVVAAAPAAHITCIDASAAMLARAAARLRREDRRRVTFERADLLTRRFDAERYDAVATFFVLDCFTEDQAASLVARVAPGLREGGRWLFADFVLPTARVSRWRARAWLAVMYCFFRWATGLRARALPPSEDLLRQAGFERSAVRDRQRGFVRSAVFTRPRLAMRRPSSGTGTAPS
jgi:ubiquinone/menaquinone biosynthesis C-methylase UbiE